MTRLALAFRAGAMVLALQPLTPLAADAAQDVPKSHAIHCPPTTGPMAGEPWQVAGRRLQLGLALQPLAHHASAGHASLHYRFGEDDSVLVGTGPPLEDDDFGFSIAYLRALADPDALPWGFEVILAAHLGGDRIERFLSPSFEGVPVLRVTRGDRSYVHILVPQGSDFLTVLVEGQFDPCTALVVEPQGPGHPAADGPGVVDVDALLSAVGTGSAAATGTLRRAGFVPISEAR